MGNTCNLLFVTAAVYYYLGWLAFEKCFLLFSDLPNLACQLRIKASLDLSKYSKPNCLVSIRVFNVATVRVTGNNNSTHVCDFMSVCSCFFIENMKCLC